MPYITQDRRYALEETGAKAQTVGELNFLITRLAVEYLHRHPVNYETMNGIMGALDCAKAEFYRRVVAPYEAKKITENGDVY